MAAIDTESTLRALGIAFIAILLVYVAFDLLLHLWVRRFLHRKIQAMGGSWIAEPDVDFVEVSNLEWLDAQGAAKKESEFIESGFTATGHYEIVPLGVQIAKFEYQDSVGGSIVNDRKIRVGLSQHYVDGSSVEIGDYASPLKSSEQRELRFLPGASVAEMLEEIQRTGSGRSALVPGNKWMEISKEYFCDLVKIQATNGKIKKILSGISWRGYSRFGVPPPNPKVYLWSLGNELGHRRFKAAVDDYLVSKDYREKFNLFHALKRGLLEIFRPIPMLFGRDMSSQVIIYSGESFENFRADLSRIFGDDAVRYALDGLSQDPLSIQDAVFDRLKQYKIFNKVEQRKNGNREYSKWVKW